MKAQLLTGIATVCCVAGQALCQAQNSLFEALRQGDTTKLRTAIRAGADVNSRDGDGTRVPSFWSDRSLSIRAHWVPAGMKTGVSMVPWGV
jgi:hypothetical protein